MHWIDRLFPSQTCPLCGRPNRSRPPWTCPVCLNQISFVRSPRCRVCGRPIRRQPLQRCRLCRNHVGPPWAWSFHLAVYEGHVRSHLHKLKFESRRGVARSFGSLLGIHLRKERRLPRHAIVVPIPLHAQRLRERGYNQAALLARHCANAIGRPLQEEALIRTKPTTVQARLGFNERFSNVRHAFWAPEPQQVSGRFVLLVDDIFTTGATCTAATTALLRAGAASVGIACVAVAVADRDLVPLGVQEKIEKPVSD